MSIAGSIEQRRMGAYQTPSATAAYMVQKLIPYLKPGAHVLDPAAGNGIFIKELLSSEHPFGSIHAWDIDPAVISNLSQLTPHAELRDGLIPDSEQFDAIIGNPPYNSQECDYIRKNREWLLQEYQEIGIYNLYALFTVSAIRRLKEGGIVSLILLDSFLTNRYHHKLRQFILENCQILEILLAPRRLFHSGKADVRTTIITLRRCSNPQKRQAQMMHLVDRVPDEQAYWNPPHSEQMEQRHYWEMDNLRFTICIPQSVLKWINNPPARLSDIVNGGAGISTGNDSKFLRRSNNTEADSNWVPFYKNCGQKAYLAESEFRIHKNWQMNARTFPNFMARNTRYYFKEGITCSSMGVRFSASYLPSGCLFGVNANLFLKEERNPEDLFYLLGFLNSTLVQYILRAVLNRTNMATPGYIKQLPFAEPDCEQKKSVIQVVHQILEGLKNNPSFNWKPLQTKIDAEVFNIYGIDKTDQAIIINFCFDILERL